VTSPLRLSFEVACPVEHAFTVWTSGFGAWWPRDHTVTGGPGLRVVLEGRVGGRIFERTRDGVEHDWGVITVRAVAPSATAITPAGNPCSGTTSPR